MLFMELNKNIPQGYKNSPLGIIPQEWEVKRLEDFCPVFKSGEGITSKNIHEQGAYPVYGGNGLRGYANSYTHNGTYVIIGRQGALCGNVNYVRGLNYISEHGIAVQTNKENDLLFWYFNLDFLNLNRFSESSAQPGLSVEKLLRHKVILPPLPEQQKIAKILTYWDTAIEKQTQLIEKLETRKRGLMQQLLTGKKRLKGFEGKWKKYQYCDILKSIQRSMSWNDGELYELISVKRRSGGLFLRESLYGHQIKTKKLRPTFEGDFLISKMQIVHGASGLTTKEFHNKKISDSYIAVIPKGKNILNIDYLNLASQMPYFYHQTYISSYGVHIEKMTFDFETFMSLSITLPSLTEQTAIANILSVADDEIGKEKEKLTALKSQKKGLMQVLLTGKKRVKI